jgi:hypothetical protein
LKTEVEKTIEVKVASIDRRTVTLYVGSQAFNLMKGDTVRVKVDLKVDDSIG